MFFNCFKPVISQPKIALTKYMELAFDNRWAIDFIAGQSSVRKSYLVSGYEIKWKEQDNQNKGFFNHQSASSNEILEINHALKYM